MDAKECFRILGIEKTKDEDKIKNAYRSMLTHVNPEDDSEGFIRLREAYEAALKYARTCEEEDVQEAVWLNDGNLGAFMKKIMDVYTYLPRRLNEEEWEQLAKDPMMLSLEDGEEAKWKLFQYLADNYRLPCRIWRKLDQLFYIEENEREFKEHLPGNFVDYILYKIHDEKGESEFPFEEFCGAPDADYDEFLEELMRVMNGNEEEEEEAKKLRKLEESLHKLATFEIEHPWYELEKVRYQLLAGEYESAEHMIRGMLESYHSDERILLNGADMLLELGYEEDAERFFGEYLERENCTEKGRYRAQYKLGKIAVKQGKWKEARQFAIDARRLWQTDEVAELIREVCEELVGQYTSRAEVLTMEEARVLGWCFYDLQQTDEGISFVKNHPEYAEDTTEYHKQMTFLYAGSRQAKETLKEAGLWRAHMQEEPEENNDSQFANCFYLEAYAYRTLFLENRENELLANEYYVQALEKFDKALEITPEYMEIRLAKVSLMRENQEYQSMVDECEKILDIDSGNFAALYYMQEAYQELRMGQEVIDTFYRAKQIYAGEPEIYLRAVKVFAVYDQYEDAMRILQQAQDAGVDGYHPLLVEKINVLDQLAEGEEEWKKADDFAENVIHRLLEEQAESKILATAYLNRAFLNENGSARDKSRLEKAKEYAALSLEQQEDVNAHYFLGRVYERYFQDGKNAYPHLKACEEQGMQFEWMYFYIARCHEHFKEWDKAIEYYKKVAEKNPDTEEAYWRIAWLYRGKFNRTEQKEYAELALQYVDMQEEKHGDRAENHRWRAVTYRRLGEGQLALEEIDKALAMEADSGMWFLRGQILRKMRRYDEAMESYQNSIRAEDRYGQDDENSYYNIFQCYIKKECYAEGVAYFEKVLEGELTKDIRDKCMDCLSDLEAQAGNHERALYWQQQRFGSADFGKKGCDSWDDEAERIEDVMNVWQQYQMNREKEIEEILEQAAILADMAYQDKDGAPEERAHVCQNMGERYYFAGNLEKSFYYFEKAVELVREYEQKNEGDEYEYLKALWRYLIRVTHLLGESEKNAEYGKLYRKELEKKYEECKDLDKTMEELMTSEMVSRSDLYSLFSLAYYTGQYEQAKHYQELLEGRDMCYWCDESDCTEFWENRGLMALHDGNEELAMECFDKANKCNWLGANKEAMMMLRRLLASRES